MTLGPQDSLWEEQFDHGWIFNVAESPKLQWYVHLRQMEQLNYLWLW